MKIVWTRRATRHLRSAYELWTQKTSAGAADLMIDQIFSAVEVLQQHPELGRTGRISGTRELVLVPLPFILAYRTRRMKIEILAILHGARKWPSEF